MSFSFFAAAQMEFSGLTDKFSNGRDEKGVEQPFMHASHPAEKSRAGATMLLPEEGIYLYGDGSQSLPQRWEYDDNGRLLFYIKGGYKACYNRTFLKEGWNIIDTATYYRDTARTIPLRRFSYNYHYYDITPVDSFYVEEIVQDWNETEQRWENHRRYYDSYADTALFNVRRQAHYVASGHDGWQLYKERVNSFVYDEQGFVKEVWDRRTSGDSLRLYIKAVFFNNEAGRPDSSYLYKRNDGEFALVRKDYFEWEEWYGFDSWGAGYLAYSPAYRQRVPIGNKQNKRSVSEKWYPDRPGELYEIRTSWDAYGSFIDSMYISYDSLQTKLLVQIENNIYNEFGDFVEACLDHWLIDEEGNPVQSGNSHEYYSYTYTDYGADGIGRDVIDIYDVKWNTELLQYDSARAYSSKITRYRGGIVVGIDDKEEEKPFYSHSGMSLSPNPATDCVIIATAEIIEQIHLYDLSGRLLKEDYPRTQQMELSLGNLSPGVYLLKARLKSGAVKVEKLVVR